jgi:hypothetical protein
MDVSTRNLVDVLPSYQIISNSSSTANIIKVSDLATLHRKHFILEREEPP